jgi:hypothetical protein
MAKKTRVQFIFEGLGTCVWEEENKQHAKTWVLSLLGDAHANYKIFGCHSPFHNLPLNSVIHKTFYKIWFGKEWPLV